MVEPWTSWWYPSGDGFADQALSKTYASRMIVGRLNTDENDKLVDRFDTAAVVETPVPKPGNEQRELDEAQGSLAQGLSPPEAFVETERRIHGQSNPRLLCRQSDLALRAST
ncbi:MAG: hypothetical protein JXB85_17315 [Anaerolineales bacterium]|nr:hypothetical protein [Anaerolineales bacterium]